MAAVDCDLRRVPQISAFQGIVIAMYYDDHGRPHFHATYGDHAASIAIDTLEVLQGGLPRRQLKLVRAWAGSRRDELRLNWSRARSDQPLVNVDPLP